MMLRRRHPTDRDLVGLADGRLSAGEHARAQQALDGHPELIGDIEAQRRALTAIRATGRERAPSSLRDRVTVAPPASAPWMRFGLLPRAATAAAALAAAVIAIVLASSGSAAPTVAQAAVLGQRPPQSAAPRPHDDQATLPAPRIAGLAFPYWADEFGYEATGVRRDQLDGRLATTVFYRDSAGQQVAYTIVSGAPLVTGGSSRSEWVGELQLRTMSKTGQRVVTWMRHGHTCVLSAQNVPLPVLLRLASWRRGGEIPY